MIMNVFIQIAKMGCFSIPRYIIQYNFPRKKNNAFIHNTYGNY